MKLKNLDMPETWPLAVSPGEAALLVGLGRTRLYEELRSGSLRSFKLGRRRMISVAALEEWLAAREAEAQADLPTDR